MKVLFISRASLFTVSGGDTTQVVKTAEALRRLGVHVDVMANRARVDFSGYDLVHFFNLIRPADLLRHLPNIRVPLVVSPIFVDYSAYDRQNRGAAFRLAQTVLGNYRIELLKCFYRALKGQDIWPSMAYLRGHLRAMKTIVGRASMLLPNSESEAGRVEKTLGLNIFYRVVPCGIDEGMFYPQTGVMRNPKQVICVGQIEGRKNQHTLIEATRDMDVDLVVVGRHSPNNRAYYEHCRAIAHDRVQFIGQCTPEELRMLYSQSAAHALPSWFETCGLVSLEAAACGCNVVVSDMGDTRDYFADYSSFCRPDDVESVRHALHEALQKPAPTVFMEKIKTHYRWEIAARETLAAYETVR